MSCLLASHVSLLARHLSTDTPLFSLVVTERIFLSIFVKRPPFNCQCFGYRVSAFARAPFAHVLASRQWCGPGTFLLCGFLAAVSRPLLCHCCSLCDLRLFVNKRMLFCVVLAPSVRRECMQYTLSVCWRHICKNGTCSDTKQQLALRCRKVVCQPARQVLTNKALCVRQYTEM